MKPRPTPRLTAARAALTQAVTVLDEFGEQRSIFIPVERPLTVFVDKRELVTLMTLGVAPELLVLGYLRNQRLLAAADEVESITVDWDVAAAAVRTRGGIGALASKTAHRVVTTGCGQGTVFGDLMQQVAAVQLPAAAQARISQRTLQAMLQTMRQQDSVHHKAGSVHGCALFRGTELLKFVEDVGRHNAIDTIAGWMWMQDEPSSPARTPGSGAPLQQAGAVPEAAAHGGLRNAGMSGFDKSFYTTGRLTSEMVMKAAQMGVPIIVSRNGITQMGHEMATRLGMTLFGRAANRHFICYTGFDRFDAEPEPLRTAARAV